MRFTLVCTSAARLPMHIVSTAEIQITQNQMSAGRAERDVENAQHHGERGGFRRGREQRGDRRGRAFVNVRRVNLERRDDHFESEADEHQPQAQNRRAGKWPRIEACEERPGSRQSAWCPWRRRSWRCRRGRRRWRTSRAGNISARLRSTSARGGGSRRARRWKSSSFRGRRTR